MLNFYKWVFEIFYRWGYNPNISVSNPENAALPLTAALTVFNIYSLIMTFQIFLFHQNELPINYVAFLGLGIYAVIYAIYYFAFVSGGKCKNINLNKERKIKKKENLFLTTYILGTFALLIILATIKP